MIAALHKTILTVTIFNTNFFGIYVRKVSILELVRREIKPLKSDIRLDLSLQVRVMSQSVVWFAMRERWNYKHQVDQVGRAGVWCC